jgi:hypothetical protein
MLAALPIMLGLQLLLAFLAYDIARVPRRRISSRIRIQKWLHGSCVSGEPEILSRQGEAQ